MTEDLIAMAKKLGTPYVNRNAQGETYFGFSAKALGEFYEMAVARTREECASLVQSNADACEPGSMLQVYLASNAAAIRALGERT